MFNLQDPPERDDHYGSNGDLVGDIGRETYGTDVGNQDSDHDVAGDDWDGDVDSL